MLVLTCVLCASAPGPFTAEASDPLALLQEGLTLGALSPATPSAAVPLALGGPVDRGAGGGDEHSDHMGPMWIVMGAMMVVMMVGMGVYFMRHSESGQALPAAAVTSPAQLAIPVTGGRPGAG